MQLLREKRNENKYNHKLKIRNTMQSYSTHRKNPKLEAILEKLDLKAII